MPELDHLMDRKGRRGRKRGDSDVIQCVNKRRREKGKLLQSVKMIDLSYHNLFLILLSCETETLKINYSHK